MMMLVRIALPTGAMKWGYERTTGWEVAEPLHDAVGRSRTARRGGCDASGDLLLQLGVESLSSAVAPGGHGVDGELAGYICPVENLWRRSWSASSWELRDAFWSASSLGRPWP